ncbi:invasion protein CiaB [Campylobacter gastrosuis]|uniref:Invasion protein CiaB n=1 Tax=Campylobacter gastrosuis TaxID=2974576 RepID=A0ABT7HNU9_9BACT|nr:invasion protein CiaB [Campylobacter gastrosuis]MDL0088465.1 invasion protein CiaB [Campylobacter gastrosuis]
MNDFKKLNELVKNSRAKLNALYKNLDNEILNKAIKISGLSGSNSEKIALLRRIVDLKPDPLLNELKKLEISQKQQDEIRDLMFDFVREIYEQNHENLLNEIKKERILDEFFIAVLELMHRVGKKINQWQIAWQSHIIDGINREFEANFKSLNEASDFINQNALFQTQNDTKADRSYGAVIKSPFGYTFAPYAVAFESEVNDVVSELENGIKTLENLAKNKNEQSYVNYFKNLSLAFSERENKKVIAAWQDAERAWMSVRDKLQPAHPLEYYEDAYTHAVALEWDVRLVDEGGIDENEFKNSVKNSFLEIFNRLNLSDESLKNQVLSNINRTQLYVSVPLLFYGAELNGLFSAQVVPNDEQVSSELGKKIFAFVNYVYENTKAKPFMKLSSEILPKEFLDFNRKILFTQPEIWRKVYEISTIGHEFGHILFVDKDTENLMNKSGVFKFIEEYKATTGGLVNFFLNEDERYKMPVFAELISRAIGLIAWLRVDEVRAYYCEAIIHLTLLFKSKTLSFKDKKLELNFNHKSYEIFKDLTLKNYENLAQFYAKKADAMEFLSLFADEFENTFLPKDEATKEFVLHFYERYKAIGNEIDESGEWQKWQEFAIINEKTTD